MKSKAVGSYSWAQKQMKILVTGVCGQLGHDVVNNAISRGHDVIGSDIHSVYSGVADGSADTVRKFIFSVSPNETKINTSINLNDTQKSPIIFSSAYFKSCSSSISYHLAMLELSTYTGIMLRDISRSIYS